MLSPVVGFRCGGCAPAMAVGVMLALVGCGGGSEADSGPVPTGVPFPVTSEGNTTDDDSEDTGEKFDVAADGATVNAEDGGSEDGCEKVDFVFVIDSSRSMEDEQDNLLASFPGFITAIEQTLEIDDFNLMVVDAGLPTGAGCDGTLGAGQVRSGAGQDCMLVGDERYATPSQPDLSAAFTCMGSRGFAGPGDEQTMDALTAAIGPLTGPGQCNEGFMRDDAILVVTIITDEEDSPLDGTPNPPLDGSCQAADSDPNSAGDPMIWRDQVVAAKGGDEGSVVVLSLIGDCDVGGSCPGIELDDPLDPLGPVSGAEPAPRLREFTQSFGFGSVGPVCAADYAPFFEQAVSVIESACDDFVPPG